MTGSRCRNQYRKGMEEELWPSPRRRVRREVVGTADVRRSAEPEVRAECGAELYRDRRDTASEDAGASHEVL